MSEPEQQQEQQMECAQEVPCAEEPVVVSENQAEEQAPEPVEQQQTEAPVVSQQGTGNHAKVQEREHRIGLLSQRISELEKEGNFSKERKQELSNLRKKLRIDKHNHNRYIKKVEGSSTQQPVEDHANEQMDSAMQEPEEVNKQEEVVEEEQKIEQPVQPVVEAVKEPPKDEEYYEEQYRQLLKRQMLNEKKIEEQQRQLAQKQFEEISQSVKELQDKWVRQTETMKEPEVSDYDKFLQRYSATRKNKTRRTLLGEAMYKMSDRSIF